MKINNYPLVSLITPCYNGGKYIDRLLNSVLSQSYPKLEYFVVDDGSTDNSAEIIKSFIPKFKSKGFELIYIHQPNSGQSSAINNALKQINGEYLLWPDCDDYYASTLTIEKLYFSLIEAGAGYSVSRCFLTYIDENNTKIQSCPNSKVAWDKKKLFKDMLLGNNRFWYCSGGYMIRVADFKQAVIDQNIYVNKRAGQNYQLLYPLLYKSYCITVPESLYSVYVRKDSHSRAVDSILVDKLSILDVYYETAKNSLRNIKMLSNKEYNYYLKLYLNQNLESKFYTYCNFGKSKLAWKVYCKLFLKLPIRKTIRLSAYYLYSQFKTYIKH